MPAPVRGALVKRFGQLLTEHKRDVADLVGVEVGKIPSEALGEVQEMIDICDFAVGLSRQLEGRTMPSERPGHRLDGDVAPDRGGRRHLGVQLPRRGLGVEHGVTLVCGDTVVWKPSEVTPLTAAAVSALLARAAAEVSAPVDLNTVVVTDAKGAAPLVDSPLIPVVSATGSERMGAQIAPRIAARFGRAILELGGNNAAVVAPTADLDLAVRGIVFAAAGTAGQRCTALRLIVRESLADAVENGWPPPTRACGSATRSSTASSSGRSSTGVPLRLTAALEEAVDAGGTVVVGGERVDTGDADAYYVRPAVVRMPAQVDVVRRETFAPILRVLTYSTFADAVALHNAVPQGLSSSIFTRDQREAERFLAADGSDCGIINVSIGTSGAEIGGAFGGEKSTGGGRESGSDAWRAYMRRATQHDQLLRRAAARPGCRLRLSHRSLRAACGPTPADRASRCRARRTSTSVAGERFASRQVMKAKVS